MKLTTQSSHSRSHPQIVVWVDDAAAGLAHDLLTHLESEIALGTTFADGRTIQIGWSILSLRGTPGQLELFEPDFQSFPISWQLGVNLTMRQLFQQRAVCELFGCDPEFPSLTQAGIACPGFANCSEYTMEREQPRDSDSGWLFSTPLESDEGEWHSLYQLALQKPSIIPLLALPPQAHAHVFPGSLRVTVGETTLTSEDSDLLRHLAPQAVR